jgi:DNA-binding NarL/FixJ family response regulator
MEEFAQINVLIADRYVLFGRGLEGLLQEERPGWAFEHAASLEEMFECLRTQPADLVLIDLSLPGLSGAEGLQEIRTRCPNQSIMVTADDEDRSTILGCLTAGAHGYVLRSTTMKQLLRAIETVLSGCVFAPAALTGAAPASRPPAMASGSPLLTHLTDRQIEVFHLLAEGCATKTIARRMGLAVGTVKVHLAAIYRVLGAHSRVEALAKARGGIALPMLVRSPVAVFEQAD